MREDVTCVPVCKLVGGSCPQWDEKGQKCGSPDGPEECAGYQRAHGKLKEKPFEYHTSDGYIFKCSKSDFSDPIQVVVPYQADMKSGRDLPSRLSVLMTAVAEMIAYHRAEVWPKFNGFAGYDCLSWVEIPLESKGDWHFERSSGYAGYRCSRCGHWVYDNASKTCNCDEMKEKPNEKKASL